jgi:hypothetical protein
MSGTSVPWITLGVLRNLGGDFTKLPAPTKGSPLPRDLCTSLRPMQFLVAVGREDATPVGTGGTL